ncbi:uncharacterized protein I303_100481 [Kwoniella dejecticola CBS 10117]|uniref:Uncharacterized protein n=1 Tax=Kwoniella dejecticola CBS 10117 TaxID=1296121 RepID=A0A1A6AF38_9TREE|nr:uncharacterized protein I303_00481 [Kwoniella dejecticola CBS 10117]OBR88664.1 hypothetical protein I303_00481 [Kwoniella dejecticola CBS 10117]
MRSTSWRSNLLFLSLFTFFILGGLVSATDAAAESNVVDADDSASKPEGLGGTIKHLLKVAIKGADPISFAKRDAEDGIERITDDNYVDLVEHSLGGGLENEVWVVLVHGRLTDPATETIMEYHKNASDLVKQDPESGNYRFARVDYITAWKTCTRWLLMRPPYLVIISESGLKLRFIPIQSLGKEPESLYQVIKGKMYEVVVPWNSRWSPDGDRSYLIEYYITAQDKISQLTNGIPSWVILAVTGVFTQQLMSWLHAPNHAQTQTRFGPSSTSTSGRVVR